MKTQELNFNPIWIVMGLGLFVRLFVHFDAFIGEPGAIHAMSIASDLAIGYVLYMVAAKIKGGVWPTIAAATWLLNPAAIYASSAWGMIEPIFVLAIIVVLILIKDKIYTAALVLLLPIAFQYRNIMGEYAYGSAGGFNFFALIGGFNQPLDTVFLGFSYSVWGAVFVLLIVLGAAWALYVDFQAQGRNFYLIIGTYFILLFVFSTGMTEFGLFPGLAFLAIHFIERRDTPMLWVYLAFSAAFFINGQQVTGAYGVWQFRDSMGLVSTVNFALVFVLVVMLANAMWPQLKWLMPAEDGERQGIPVKYYIVLLLAVGFLIRIFAVVNLDFRFAFEVGRFKTWATGLYEHGLAAYYGSGLIPHAEHPPVYLYVLYVLGALRAAFGWATGGAAFDALIFMPAIICDLAIGYVLYRRAAATQRQHSRARLPFALAAFWILNPAIILISSIWGQVDSVFALVLLLSLLRIRDRKLLSGYVLYAVAVLTNPFGLFLFPVYAYSGYSFLEDAEFSFASIKELCIYIFATAAAVLLIFIPFGLRAAPASFWR